MYASYITNLEFYIKNHIYNYNINITEKNIYEQRKLKLSSGITGVIENPLVL